jgi:hypothetical protein
MSVLIVAHPVTNVVITPSTKNVEYGTFRVDSEKTSFENGFMNKQKRSAFIRGKISDLESLGLRAGQTLPGQIVKRESFAPFYDGQNSKINPSTGEVVLKEGKETFLEFVFTSDMSAHDAWVGESTAVLTAEAQSALSGQDV